MCEKRKKKSSGEHVGLEVTGVEKETLRALPTNAGAPEASRIGWTSCGWLSVRAPLSCVVCRKDGPRPCCVCFMLLHALSLKCIFVSIVLSNWHLLRGTWRRGFIARKWPTRTASAFIFVDSFPMCKYKYDVRTSNVEFPPTIRDIVRELADAPVVHPGWPCRQLQEKTGALATTFEIVQRFCAAHWSGSACFVLVRALQEKEKWIMGSLRDAYFFLASLGGQRMRLKRMGGAGRNKGGKENRSEKEEKRETTQKKNKECHGSDDARSKTSPQAEREEDGGSIATQARKTST